MRLKALLIPLLLLALTGCGAFAKAEPTPLPTVVLNNGPTGTPQASSASTASTTSAASGVNEASSSGGAVSASGVVVAAQEAQMGFAAGGKVKTVNVAVGDAVKTGQVLASLAGSEQLQAAVSAAELDVLTAQQDLDKLNREADLQRANVQLAIVQAQKALDDAKQHRLQLSYRATQDQILAAEASYQLAQNNVDHLQGQYDLASSRPEKDPGRLLALANLINGKRERDKALISLNWYKGKADPKDIAEADVNVSLAQANLEDTQAQLDKVKNGPDTDQAALLQARLKNAQDQVQAAHANLDDLQLKAPFDGMVADLKLSAGDIVSPSQILVIVSNVNRLHVDTTDLSERDVPSVQVGQPATVFIKALKQNVNGHVSLISPLADTLGGDVVYKTSIELDQLPAGIRPGMTVDVQFGQ